jgi:predicted TIM-barrel fold metal-dependent hydrolase
MIVDAHMHLGECRIFDNDVTEQALLEALDRNQVDAAIVQPFPGAPDPRAVHDRIANLAAKQPGRIFGLASISPHCDQDEYYREIERCVRDLRFVAVKLHTIGHAVNPLHRDGELVFATAAALKIPVMVHTGPGVPFALPSLTLRGARKYPDTPVVLAHAGALIYTQEAMVTAEMADNIYLETSWIGPPMIGMVIRRLGAERVMFGSDLLPNIPTELVKYRTIGLSEEELATSMQGTAARVFGLPLDG